METHYEREYVVLATAKSGQKYAIRVPADDEMEANRKAHAVVKDRATLAFGRFIGEVRDAAEADVLRRTAKTAITAEEAQRDTAELVRKRGEFLSAVMQGAVRIE